jgi:glucosylceramidase
MRLFIGFCFVLLTVIYSSCQTVETNRYKSIQTSASGEMLKEQIASTDSEHTKDTFLIDLNKTKQEVTGFGGAFTESSAQLIFGLSEDKRAEVIQQYFGDNGAQYSLCRTHINSCDFSVGHYSYEPIADDTLLRHFDIAPDTADLIPMIKLAQQASSAGFNLVASPWTAPPWMKDNNDWYGGSLLPKYESTWADYFVQYHRAYASHGIGIWGYTVENEPLGNDANWESMHFTPAQMSSFVKNHLGPTFKEAEVDANILIYDQNRGEELVEWAEAILTDETLDEYVYGTAVHWYTSTVDWMPESLNKCHELAPDKHIIHTEGCIDAEVPHWKDDAWYWSKEATDWGFDWAPEEDKADHPKYVPTYRYARDMIGCLNNWVEGWIDWNMVLDRGGGPNLAQNWCIAPVIVDTNINEVYYTPLFYIMSHFSKYVRPGALVLDLPQKEGLMSTAAKNEDGILVVVVLNEQESVSTFTVEVNGKFSKHEIGAKAIQTIIFE